MTPRWTTMRGRNKRVKERQDISEGTSLQTKETSYSIKCPRQSNSWL